MSIDVVDVIGLAFLYCAIGYFTYFYYAYDVVSNKSKTISYDDYPVQIVLLHPIFIVIALCKFIKKQSVKSVEFVIKITDYSDKKRRKEEQSERISKASED